MALSCVMKKRMGEKRMAWTEKNIERVTLAVLHSPNCSIRLRPSNLNLSQTSSLQSFIHTIQDVDAPEIVGKRLKTWCANHVLCEISTFVYNNVIFLQVLKHIFIYMDFLINITLDTWEIVHWMTEVCKNS